MNESKSNITPKIKELLRLNGNYFDKFNEFKDLLELKKAWDASKPLVFNDFENEFEAALTAAVYAASMELEPVKMPVGEIVDDTRAAKLNEAGHNSEVGYLNDTSDGKPASETLSDKVDIR